MGLLSPSTAPPTSAQTLDEVVEWTDSLQLEEPEGIYTVTPEVRIDSNEIIVTDLEESEVRIYTRSGSLKTAFGKKGTQAPGALRGPSAALRLSSGRFLVPDMLTGHLSLFDEKGEFVKRHERVVVRGNLVYDLPGEDVLLVGSKTAAPGAHALLHRFDPSTGTIEKSFFPHPAPIGSYGNYLSTLGRIAAADVRGDTIAAVFSIFDTLYVYTSDGTLKRTVDLPLSHFQQLEKPNGEVTSREEYAETLTSHSRMTHVFWVNDHTLLLQYRETTDVDSEKGRSNLVGVTTEGEVLFEVTDTPKLLAVDPNNQKLYFNHPEHVAPNHWIVGRLNPSILTSSSAQ